MLSTMRDIRLDMRHVMASQQGFNDFPIPPDTEEKSVQYEKPQQDVTTEEKVVRPSSDPEVIKYFKNIPHSESKKV